MWQGRSIGGQQYRHRPRNLHPTALSTQTCPPTRIYMHFHLPPITFTTNIALSTRFSSFALSYIHLPFKYIHEVDMTFPTLLLVEELLWAFLHKSGWSCLWKWGTRGAPVKTLDSLISSLQIPGDTGDHHPERFRLSMGTYLFENGNNGMKCDFNMRPSQID